MIAAQPRPPLRAAWLVLLLGVCAPACQVAAPFSCEQSTQCEDGDGGRCEANGYCSYVDAECPHGRRYGPGAASGLAGQCIGDVGTDDSPNPQPSADSGASRGADAEPSGTDAGIPCHPTSCTAANAECGTISDGCGGTTQCGRCPMRRICGGEAPNRCGDDPCTPTTCAAEGADCGDMSDGCAATLNCGSCTAPNTCGGGGQANRCGCTAQSCADQGKNCGNIADGCGAALDCGVCSGGDECVDNICVCPPRSCSDAAAECGVVPDGCGSFLFCGACPPGEVCEAGPPNQCRPCAPASCAELGAECGFAIDGCGNVRDCGDCPVGEFCGAGGQPNRCAGF